MSCFEFIHVCFDVSAIFAPGREEFQYLYCIRIFDCLENIISIKEMWISRLVPLLTPSPTHQSKHGHHPKDIRVHSFALLYSYYYNPFLYLYSSYS